MAEPTSFVDKEIIALIAAEVSAATGVAVQDVPTISADQRAGRHFASNVSKYAASLKQPAPDVAARMAAQVNAMEGKQFIAEATAEKAFLNFKVFTGRVYKLVVERVLALGPKYGSSSQPEPKTVMVEHTSANPNAPLHVGNLRSGMIGMHLANLFAFTGWNVRQHYYVNDLGGQIGLSALGYQKLIDAGVVPPGKVDQIIGYVYAIMNTFSQAQKLGFVLSEFQAAVTAAAGVKEEEEEDTGPKISKKNMTPEQLAAKKAKDRIATVAIGASLKERFPELWESLTKLFPDSVNVAAESARLNKAYEDKEPAAVAILRRMVCDTLSGIQATLDIYGVHHDQFDFESELSWDGSSQALISRFRELGYYNEHTPDQGAWINLDQFMIDAGMPRGKGGYQPDYPKFYATRPDGTTLYTLRDVTYSLNKLELADLVLNVICTEQNLPQEKVAIALRLTGVEKPAQFHVQNEFVKLRKGTEIVRMSGRRGIYVLSDEIYHSVYEATFEVIKTRAKRQIADDDLEGQKRVADVIAPAATKYALLCVAAKQGIDFDIKAAVDPTGNSAPFILYAGARIKSILRKFDQRVAAGQYAPPPAEIDYSLLTEEREWGLLAQFLLPFASVIWGTVNIAIPPGPRLPDYGVHVIPQFMYQLALKFASYYGAGKILDGSPRMYTRLQFCRAVVQVLDNALALLAIKPLEAM